MKLTVQEKGQQIELLLKRPLGSGIKIYSANPSVNPKEFLIHLHLNNKAIILHIDGIGMSLSDMSITGSPEGIPVIIKEIIFEKV